MATGDVLKLRTALIAAKTAICESKLYEACNLIDTAYALTTRTSVSRLVTARKKAKHVTVWIRDQVKLIDPDNRIESQQEIADRFGLGAGGRVNDIWQGKYDHLK